MYKFSISFSMGSPVGYSQARTTKRKATNNRTSSSSQSPREARILKLELKPDEKTETQLKVLTSTASKLWNEITYARRQQYFATSRVDLKGTYKEYYEKYKLLIGSATTQQVIIKNNEAWRSFFSLRKKGEKANPPGYKKQNNQRKLWVVLRNDQYKIDWDRQEVVIKGLGAVGWIRTRFNTNKHIEGKQGRAEIFYDADRKKWYMIVTIYPEKKRYPKDEWHPVPLEPLGELVAGIDLGINNLFAVYVTDLEIGEAESFLINGRPLKAMAYWFVNKIAELQSKVAKTTGKQTSRRIRVLYAKWRRKSKDYINKAVRQLVHRLWKLGVSKIFVGVPKYIAKQKGSFLVTNVWSYGYVLRRLREVAWEYGIEIDEVNEANTSSTDPFTGKVDKKKRVHRGLFIVETPDGPKAVNADVLGAFNILVKGLIAPSPRRGRGNGPKAGPGGAIPPNLPALASPKGILAL